MQKQIIVVCAFIALDVVTGIIKAFSSGSYRSLKMREGLVHKLTECVAVAFGILVDYSLPIIGVNINFSMFTALVVYVTLMESGSIIENIGTISPQLGEKLKTLFQDTGGNNGGV